MPACRAMHAPEVGEVPERLAGYWSLAAPLEEESSAAFAVPGGWWQTLFLAMHEFPQGLPFRQTGPVRLVLRVVDRDRRAAAAGAPSIGHAVALSGKAREQSRVTRMAR